MAKLRYLLPLVGILFMLDYGYSLQCYECASKDESAENPYCKDPFGKAYADENYGTTETVSRWCIKKPDGRNGCRIVEGASSFYFECLCDTDFCNSGHTLLPNISFIILTILLSIFFVLKS
ncbi:hypothetical protein KUTeg_023522 [Tegillarca granosa]|uniref:Protein quiver n=1 Tax=Tegillarca granosa TaxID=220873 RepID=A0ABQ9E6G8_TEGGR|nr:hypothetical protein KUTeg_023522 [Tegillarca granosa]